MKNLVRTKLDKRELGRPDSRVQLFERKGIKFVLNRSRRSNEDEQGNAQCPVDDECSGGMPNQVTVITRHIFHLS